MKAIGIVGSPRKNGNTELLTSHALKAIEEEGIDTELIRLAGLDIKPCTGCLACHDEESCPIKDDLWPIYLKMKEADAIILSTPVYFSGATGLMRSFMERAGYVALKSGRPFAGKVGGPLVVSARSGQNATIAQLYYWFHVLGFFIPGSTYFNMAFGRKKGEVEQDEIGMQTAWDFAKNVAFLVKKLRA
ncbi:2-amino-4-deoxychorismate dehydrogenase [subsurface metagenome]